MLSPMDRATTETESWRRYDKIDMELREKRKSSGPEGSSTRSLRSQP